MPTRREFLKATLIAGLGCVLPFGTAAQLVAASPSRPGTARRALAIPGGTLDPLSIEKYNHPLVIPPAMPRTSTVPIQGGKTADYYEIAVRQFTQQILPSGMPQTTVWSYGSQNHAGSFNYPAFTIEATSNTQVRVKWINGLVNAEGGYLPHLLAVDPTLHWANPSGGTMGRDMRPTFQATPGPYTGPVPIVTHVHGAHTTQESDGYAEAWYLPAADNIPAGYAETGTYYDVFKASAESGAAWEPGSAVFDYPNDQRATTLWYHDHTLGMTRLNVYAGPAGFYIIRGGPDDRVMDSNGGEAVLPGPAPALGDAPDQKYYEIPIAVQDRSFNTDGSLFYPDSRVYFDGIAGPYIPESDISPMWNPEFFGNTMVVNGKTWPVLEVEPRRYRFRFLNGCNSRFLILQMSDPALKFWQIGAEGGFLSSPVELTRLLMSPAERADCIVDFTGLAQGTEIILHNLGPDEPFGGGEPGVDFVSADAATTGQVMKFRVGAPSDPDPSTPPARLVLPALSALPQERLTRQLSLNEMMSMHPGFDGPAEALLGTVVGGVPVHKMWDDEITENPAVHSVEVWEFYNFTADAHPIHIHQVMFEVVNRQGLVLDEDGEPVVPVQLAGGPRAPEPAELGRKDTVIAYPGEVTRVKARFDIPGLFVWHCHIVEHEDNEMMRPYQVLRRVFLPHVAKS